MQPARAATDHSRGQKGLQHATNGQDQQRFTFGKGVGGHSDIYIRRALSSRLVPSGFLLPQYIPLSLEPPNPGVLAAQSSEHRLLGQQRDNGVVRRLGVEAAVEEQRIA